MGENLSGRAASTYCCGFTAAPLQMACGGIAACLRMNRADLIQKPSSAKRIVPKKGGSSACPTIVLPPKPYHTAHPGGFADNLVNFHFQPFVYAAFVVGSVCRPNWPGLEKLDKTPTPISRLTP